MQISSLHPLMQEKQSQYLFTTVEILLKCLWWLFKGSSEGNSSAKEGIWMLKGWGIWGILASIYCFLDLTYWDYSGCSRAVNIVFWCNP